MIFNVDRTEDYLQKKQWADGIPNPYPVRTPLAVKINQDSYDSLKDTLRTELAYSSIYIYKTNTANQILEERAHQINYIVENDSVSNENLEHRISYHYNEKGQLIRKDIKMREFLKDAFIEQMLFEGIIFSIRDRLHYEYEYDEKDRLKKFSLWRRNQKCYSEEYVYNANHQPISVYYYIPDRSITRKISVYTKTLLDKHGNPVEEIGMEKDGTVTGRRFYEYTYDDHGNWIHVNIYLDGHKDKPSKYAKRIITYYKETDMITPEKNTN